MFKSFIKGLIAVSTLTLCGVASALPLSSNTSYSLSGAGLGTGDTFASGGGLFLAFYQTDHGSTLHAGDFYVYMNLNGTMNTGNISGTNLSLLDVLASGNTVTNIVRYNGTAWENVSGGSGTLTTSLDYNNVTINNSKDKFALINGTGTASNGQLDLTLAFGGNSATISQNIAASSMAFDSTTSSYYSPVINAFSNTGVLDFAMAGFNDRISGWFYALNTVQFGGKTFYLQGDIHANYSNAVPEPATMGLLTAGLLGCVARRRKNIAS